MSADPSSPRNAAPAQPNQSLIDGLTCLQIVAGSGEAVGSRELARLAGLEPTRVNRLLKTLAYLGLTEQDEKRRYRPGPAVHVLAAQSLRGSGLLRRAIGPLEDLYDLGLTVALGVLWKGYVSYLFYGSPGMKTGDAIGRRGAYPAAISGLGQAILATDDPAEAQAIHADPIVLATVRKQGYAVAPSPDDPPNRTVAIALGSPPFAAIGVAGIFADGQIKELVARLRAAATRIETPG